MPPRSLLPVWQAAGAPRKQRVPLLSAKENGSVPMQSSKCFGMMSGQHGCEQLLFADAHDAAPTTIPPRATAYVAHIKNRHCPYARGAKYGFLQMEMNSDKKSEERYNSDLHHTAHVWDMFNVFVF